MQRVEAEQLLKLALNDYSASFRDGQWEAIDSVVNQRKKVLVIQRTGWGKSAVYFIASKIFRTRGQGISIIISPLLALMRNQVESAERLGIRAVTLNSSNVDEWDNIKARIFANQVDCLLISPERLANEDFLTQILQPISAQIALMVIDEAHCISDWGHDFRPDYRRIVGILRRMPPNTPVLCTTATANERVINDIQAQIGQIEILRGSLMRTSLHLQTLNIPKAAERLTWLVQAIRKFKGTGIVYTLTTETAEKVARWLNENHIQASAYYSGVTHPEFESGDSYRLHLEQALQQNQLKVLVATSALGMGYDKPDISFVIHYQMPNSIIGYYQQVGRAGRGVPHALGVLMGGEEDDRIQAFFRHSAFPGLDEVNQILSVLEKSDGLRKSDLQKSLNLKPATIEKVLKYLNLEDPPPIIKQGTYWKRTLHRYHYNQQRIAQLTQQRIREWEEIRRYLLTPQCKMHFLQQVLDDKISAPCGQCDSCLSRPVVDIQLDAQILQQAQRFLQHSEMVLTPRKRFSVSIYPQFGFSGNIPEGLRPEIGRILSRWGEEGWGSLVKQGKQQGRFDDALVEACAEMIVQRWKPNPMPQWVCAVPSLRSPHLVNDFAQRLARRLNLPFVDCIQKLKDNPPQKLQHNSYHQCLNLDGVFEITNHLYKMPALLVDDVYDSGWTLTVISALLKQAGVSAVYPCALANTMSDDEP